MDERLVVDANEVLVEEPVHEAIPDACNRNLPLLRVIHAEGEIGTVPVRSVRQFAVQLRKILFQIETKVLQLERALLPAHESLPAAPENR